MGLERIDAARAIEGLTGFDAIIDARSPSEYREDHLPGAVNWPSLDDAQRHEVGTLYTQVSAFEARKLGAALVARNIADHVDRHVRQQEREWRPLVYCWRGGQRSGALALVLSQIGFRVTVLEGGYKAFRREVRQELDKLPSQLSWRVLCGRTGTGKTRLLAVLQAQGAQALDLEALAVHRGSVLGGFEGQAQPSQKAFETALWTHLRRFDRNRPVFVESESRKIGQLRLPDTLLLRMRESPCISLEMPRAARVALLMQEYAGLVADAARCRAQLAHLTHVRGRECVARWQQLAERGDWPALVRELLEVHYDPIYEASMGRHYPALAQALTLNLPDASPQAMQAAAMQLQRENAPTFNPCADRR